MNVALRIQRITWLAPDVRDFELRTLEGLQYDPFRRKAWRNTDVGVNYLAHAEKVVAG